MSSRKVNAGFGLALCLGVAVSVLSCPPGVTDLVCTEVPEGVQLTWTNNDNGTYTFIEIVRDDVSIATLPVDATSYFDATVPSGQTIYVVLAHDGAAPTGAACILGAEPLVLRSPDLTATTGAVIDVPIAMDCPFVSFGFSFGYEHDPDKVTFVQGVPGATMAALNNGDGPDFFTLQSVVGVESGFFTGCVYNFVGQNGLPAGDDHELVVATYDVDAEFPDTTELDFTSTLGDPPVAVVVVVLPSYILLVPETSGTILNIVEPGASFIRGDSDDDGTVGLPDVLVTLSAMFLGGELLCHAAADANDDMQLSLVDPILCLNYLYRAGPPPEAPFPGCGSDPVNMGCDQYLSCP